MGLVSIIVATARNNVIGSNNELPWQGKLPADMEHFVRTTKGAAVIMGRKTYESIPARFRPLKNRTNIVISRSKNFDETGCKTVGSLEEALAFAASKRLDAFIAGGGSIYEEALSGKYRIDQVIRTLIEAEVQGDTFFPPLDRSWQLVQNDCHAKDEENAFSYCFQVYKHVKLPA